MKLKNDHRLCVAYDNFQYYQRVGAGRLGEFDDLRQYTTGKFYLGADMPEGGLRQDMLNPNIFLNDVNILDAQGNHYDDIQKQISNFFITEAIRQAYPDLILVDGSITPTKAKSCTHQSLNLVGKGVNAIHSGAISNFNQQISELQQPKGDIRRTHPAGNNDNLSSNVDKNSEKDNSIHGSDTGDDEGDNSDNDSLGHDIPREEAHLYSLMVLSPL